MTTKNKLFACFMMTLFPVSLLISFLSVQPDAGSEYVFVLLLSFLLWFLFHSLILLVMIVVMNYWEK